MLYCMGILRLVNCVIEKTRRREDVSIADAARAIGIPRKLIDLRHGKNLWCPFLGYLVVYIKVFDAAKLMGVV